MNNVFRWPVFAVALVATSLVISRANAATQEAVAFPDGYRSWVHVSTAVISGGASDASLHHIYANAKAVEGYRTSHFPNGSVIVFDKFSLEVSGTTTKAGNRQIVDVMVRDSARFRETGGWGFDEFVGDSHTQHSFEPARAAATCFKCHDQLRRDNDFVFTALRDADRMKL